ncbi:MAG TPA: hypothetical protein VJT72_13265 [Pseudonocardiaceae bacterium]|nr:hypothetical protein [Pseudonocardiaceae bacterium]
MTGQPEQSPPWVLHSDFTGKDGRSAGAPFLLPPGATPFDDLTATVPLLYTGDKDYGRYKYENADFTFSLHADFSPVKEPYQSHVLARIEVHENSWKCEPSVRESLAAHFVELLTSIESKFERTGVLVEGASMRIGRAVIDTLPLRMDEILPYYYALSTGRRPGTKVYADLLPGMRLRLETSVSQYLGPSQPLNGYVAAASTSALIGSVPAAGGRRTLTFDPFLGAIAPPVIQRTSTQARLVGGIIDLHPAGAARSHWRIFYPTSMQTPVQPGNTGLDYNVGIVGADTLEQMNVATKRYPMSSSVAGPTPTLYYVVLGRAVAVPEIHVRVNHARSGLAMFEYVSLGTTVADVIQRFTMIPLDPQSEVVSVSRRLSDGRTAEIVFKITTPAVPAAMWDLPLVSDDSVTIQLPK